MPSKKPNLLDSYLQSVQFWLPRAQQKDIIAELAEDLHSQIDEREAALGHPLAEADLIAILKRRGSPLQVASSYLPEQRLINPAMLPVYRMVLNVVLLWVLTPLFFFVFVAPALTSDHPGRAILTFLDEAWRTGFLVVGIVTTVFVLLDRYHTKIKGFDDWDPRKLPLITLQQPPMGRCNAFANFTFMLAGAVFWGVMMWHRSEIVLGDRHVILAPIWNQVYWIVLALTLGDAFVELFSFLNTRRIQARAWLRLTMDAISILVAAILLRVGTWVEVTGLNLTAPHITKLVHLVHMTIEFTLFSVVAIKMIDAIVQIRRLSGGKPGSHAPILTTS